MTSSELALLVREWADGGLSDEIDADSSIEAVAGHKLAIDTIRAALRDADSYLSQLAADAAIIPPGGEYLPGIGKVEQKWRPSGVKWDSEGLISLLVAQALDERRIDKETGEALEPEHAPVLRVLRECSSFETPSHSWRAGAVRERVTRAGRELDEYQEIDRNPDGSPVFIPYIKITKEAS